MNYEDILDDIEALEVPKRVSSPQVMGFKKKAIKSKNSTLRSKEDEKEEEEEQKEEQKETPLFSRRRHFKTYTTKTRKTPLADLFDDPEYAPVIENLTELTEVEREQLLGTSNTEIQSRTVTQQEESLTECAPSHNTQSQPISQTVAPKYVPIETNSFVPLSTKQMKKELKLEYSNEYNYDDGSNIQDVVEVDEDEDDDDFLEDEPLDENPPMNQFYDMEIGLIKISNGSYDRDIGTLNINKDVYDLELGSDSDMEPEEILTVPDIYKITPLEEEVNYIQDTIERLEISLTDRKEKKLMIHNDMESIRTKKEEILERLKN